MAKTTVADFPRGTRVTGRIPTNGSTYSAVVDRHDGNYVVTKDAAGKERKAQPGLLTKA